YKFGWNDPEFKPVNKVRKGLDREVVAQISEMKNEPQWMRDFRLRALELFESKPMPAGFWGGNIQGYPLDFNDIYYYVKPMEGQGNNWTRSRPRSSGRLISSASPRPSASSSPASAPRTTLRSFTTRSAKT